ncbi:MAG: Ig-like domain-containing protein, partial [Rubripirellula sp.]
VLANDTRDVDNQTFELDSVGVPSAGGSVRISDDGTQFLYAPAPDFNGTEQVTYTIRDSGGGIAVGTVTFTVTADNDAPPAIDLTSNVGRDTTQQQIFGLSDLPANVDSGETLTVTAPQNSTQGGTITIDSGTQSIFYTPPSDSFIGTDTVTYTVADGSGETSTATITIVVSDYTERSITLTFDQSLSMPRIDGIMLRGTSIIGDTVEVPLTYTEDSAAFMSLLPGSYVIEIPANPFLQNAEVPRQIAVESLADAGDSTVDAEIGRLKAQFLSIRDWLGSAPARSVFAAVSPGETSSFAVPSADANLAAPVVELDSDGMNLSVRGQLITSDSGSTTVRDVEASLATVDDARVETRAVIDGVRLIKINVDESEVTFNDVSSAEGEFVAGEGEGEQVETLSQLTVGDVQAEGESVVTAAVTQADVFVPASDEVSTRTDAAVLATEQGDVWVGESLTQDEQNNVSNGSEPVDDAMQNVAEELTIVQSAGDDVAESREALDENAIDAVLGGNL